MIPLTNGGSATLAEIARDMDGINTWLARRSDLWGCDCNPSYESDTNATNHQDECAIFQEIHIDIVLASVANWMRSMDALTKDLPVMFTPAMVEEAKAQLTQAQEEARQAEVDAKAYQALSINLPLRVWNATLNACGGVGNGEKAADYVVKQVFGDVKVTP